MASAIAAKYTPQGEGLAGEGWNINFKVIEAICTEFGEPFSRQLLNQADVGVAVFDSILNVRSILGSWFEWTSIANGLQTSLWSRKNSWDLFTRARALLPSSPFKSPSPGMSPIWNCLDMCVRVANLGSHFAQLRDHGSWKREMCSNSLRNHPGDGGICSRLK